MPSVRTDDNVNLQYRVSGTGARNLVFVHGYAQSGYLFDDLVRSLDLTGLRCITLDLRGHGESDKVTTGYTRDRLAKDIMTVVDHADAQKFVVVGFSASARMAQYIACTQQKRVQGQVLLAGCPTSVIPLPAEQIAAMVSCQGDAAKMEGFAKSLWRAPPSPAAIKAIVDQAVRIPREGLEGALHLMTKDPFQELLATMTAPALIVGGADDPFFAPDAIRQGVAAAIPRVRTVFIPETGHWVPVERAAETARLIEAFLAGLPAS